MTLHVVPDPTGAEAYATDHNRVVMGSKLVEYRRNGGANELWHVGSQTTLFAEPDQILLATHTVASAVIYPVVATATQTLVLLSVNDGLSYQYWIVGSDGSQASVDGGTADAYAPVFSDQRLAASFQAYYDQGSTLVLRDVTAGTVAGTLSSTDPAYAWNAFADTWAAHVLADNTHVRTQPSPPAPFTVVKTSIGHHTADHELVFNYYTETGDKFTGAWADAEIAWTKSAGYSGPEPVIDFGRLRVGTLVADIPESSGAATPLFLGFPAQASCSSAYLFSPNVGNTSTTGSPAVFLATAGNVGVPSNAMDFITATLTGSVHITPGATYAYRLGEYRYLNALIDETSTYATSTGTPPGAEFVRSDFIDEVEGRYTAVVGLVQESDFSGGGTQCTMCVHFEPFIVGEIVGDLDTVRTRFF